MSDVTALKRSLLRAVAKSQQQTTVKQTTTAKPAVVSPTVDPTTAEDDLKHEQHRTAVLNCFYNYYTNK